MNNPADKSDDKEETLAERSARLEREAMEGKFEIKHDDPLNEYNETQDQELAQNMEDYESAADSYENSEPSDEGQQNPQNAELQNATIKALQDEADTAKEKMMRAVADAENTKRRIMKEMTDTKKYAISSFSRDLLNVSDNLRRALDAVPDDLKEDVRLSNLIEGIEATERELLRAFEKNGIQKLEPMDEIFDPNFHEVMFEAPVPDKPAGAIIQIIETGYLLHDRLLRPARVGVAKNDGLESAPLDEPGQNIDTEA